MIREETTAQRDGNPNDEMLTKTSYLGEISQATNLSAITKISGEPGSFGEICLITTAVSIAVALLRLLEALMSKRW
jgi:hypothetical protein